MTSPSRAKLKAACDALALADPALDRAYRETGLPVWRDGEPTYATLARMVSHQLISLSAAAAIWSRTEALLGDVTPEAVLAVDPGALRACGQSGPKVGHLVSIAESLVSGRLSLARVCAAPLVDARKELLAVKGIGPWTAELFLLYATGAMDAFPVGDVGLMEAHKLLSAHETRMDIKGFTAQAELWRPYRGVAAHLLWAWLHVHRAASGRVGVQP
jgi:DNA-3-methyladenine glycosylase II